MTKQLFRKKSQIEDDQPAGEKTGHTDSKAAGPVGEDEPPTTPEAIGKCEEETTRLSCDIRRSHHRALRIAAAHCERSITDMLETLGPKTFYVGRYWAARAQRIPTTPTRGSGVRG